MKNIDHLESLIGSINKMINNARNKGIIRSKELYLLNLIYKLISNSCYNNDLLEEDKKLLILYYKLFSKYNFLCKTSLSSNYYINNNIKNTYINTNINTPPIIEDPVIIDPDPIETISACNGTAGIFPYLDYINMEYGSFTKCYDNPELVFKSIKILSLPTKGVLQYNESNLEINTVIDFEDIYNLTYTPFVERELFLEDTFTYTMTTDEIVPRITEIATITMIIR